jgi:hypothetical protein
MSHEALLSNVELIRQLERAAAAMCSGIGDRGTAGNFGSWGDLVAVPCFDHAALFSIRLHFVRNERIGIAQISKRRAD